MGSHTQHYFEEHGGQGKSIKSSCFPLRWLALKYPYLHMALVVIVTCLSPIWRS